MKDQRLGLVYVPVPNQESAEVIAKATLEARLVACANIIPAVQSYYWWQGSIQCDQEAVLILKTYLERFDELEALIKNLHPYDCPAILFIKSKRCNKEFFQFVGASLMDPS